MKKLGMLLMLLFALAMGSHRVYAQSVTITLMPGWNWISIPLMDTLDFETAMGSVTPIVGDIIKSRWGSATYTSDGQWRGSISQFYPGYGYHYKSNRTMPVMLTFNTPQPVSQVIVTTTEPTDITANSATCGGNVASSNGDYVSVTLRGICWSTNPNPTFNDNYVELGNGLGSFTASMTDLAIGTTYYVRAFAVTGYGTYYGNEVNFTTSPPEGAINGLFTINSNGDQVYFSRGNLQYIGSAVIPYWKFADNQWDYLGTTTGQNSANQNVDRDLFGWGTSGYSHGAICYRPWSTSTNYSDYNAYGSYSYNLYEGTGKADWGYNSISNGGNQLNQWRTLTYDEWRYVIHQRSTISGIRWARGIVNGVKGIILFSDDWTISNYPMISTNGGNFNSNIISASDWTNTFEINGAIFLPAAGQRCNTWLNVEGSHGYYWSSSYLNNSSAFDVHFSDDILYQQGSNDYRHYGHSVRLVRDAE